MYWLN